MSNQQSIIVYRSQQEKLIDDFFMSGDAVPIVCGLAAGVAVFVCLIGLSKYIKQKTRIYKNSNWYQSIGGGLSRLFYWIPESIIYSFIAGVIGVMVINKMWL